MSKLNIYHHELRHKEYAEFYLKYEADKVIEEKDAEIERLEILCANYRHDCDNLAISNEQAKRSAQTLRKKMNYQKYKRCVATADLCFREYQTYCALIERGEECFSEMDFYGRWNKIWLILAEKFKEAK